LTLDLEGRTPRNVICRHPGDYSFDLEENKWNAVDSVLAGDGFAAVSSASYTLGGTLSSTSLIFSA